MRIALAIASLVILVVHGFVFFQQFFHQWERHQTAYFDQARTLAKSDTERAALAARSPRIEQYLVTQFGETRVDRCGTCHIAMDDPRFTGHAQPLKTHPYTEALGDRKVNGKWERRHKFADFGCTVCHAGQGRGLKPHFAHGEDHYWPDPLTGYVVQANWRADLQPKLKGKEYMEANCVQCHTERGFAGTQWVERGRKLFFDTNCWGCHKIEGLSDGALGPELSEVGHRFKADYIYESILEPRANSSTSFMPKFNLPPDDVKALVIFLQSRRGKNFAETSIDRYRLRLAAGGPEAAPNAPLAKATAGAAPGKLASLQEQRGKQLITDHACVACHKIDGKDGGVSPDLSYIGSIRDEKWLMDHFKDPRSRIPDSNMPAFRFPAGDFEALSAYLLTKTAPPPAGTGADLYKELCLRCHGDQGDGHGQIAIYLDPYPRDFTKTGFMNSKPRERFLDSMKNGVAGTSMPPWAKVLKPEQMDSILQHIEKTFTKDARREIKGRKVPEQNPVALTAESANRGERMFIQRCSGCHGRKADGKGPNSLDILPRPRNLLNAAFVESVSDRRMFESILYGVQGTAMPAWIDYGLSTQEVGDLINFIRKSNVKPASKQAVAANQNGSEYVRHQ
jgi:mono/diheme cytochrome c family protein